MTSAVRIAVVGGGVIGRRHVAWLRDQPDCVVTGIADPSEDARVFCADQNLPWFADYRVLLDTKTDGAIICTPNSMHLPMGLECLARGLPMLMEKPVADTAAAAIAFTRAAQASTTPVLIGHYRRHSTTAIAARDMIAAGELGRLVSIDLRLMFLKPHDYFRAEWRSRPGGGPVMINFVHDVDMLRFMCGEIASVQACTSSAVRGSAVEDTAAVILQLDNGVLVTANLSDTIVSPYSWDLNAGEEPSFDVNGKDVYLIGGTDASLALPSLRMWRYADGRGWMNPILEQQRSAGGANPYVRQCAHFLRVVRGIEPPLVTAAQSTRSQMVAEAVGEAARTGTRIDMSERFAAFDEAVAA